MSNRPAPDLLTAMVEAARHAARGRAARRGIGALEAQLSRAPAGALFEAALRGPGNGPRIIAECKRRSPSKGILREHYDPAAHARAYAAAGAAAISVLTEPTFFDGHPDHLRAVRAATNLPLLRKDFIVSEYQLVEACVLGADAVLLIVGALADDELRDLLDAAARRRLAALVEVHDAGELGRALDAGARIVGVNSRNLRTLHVDPGVLEELRPLIPPGITAVAESGIRSSADLSTLSRQGYDAFLVGERLITQPDPGAALRELRGVASCA